MRHAAMLWGNVKRELGKFLTKVFVGGSLTGIGTEADPIELKGDEESPEPNYYYGTDEDGEKGYHELISLKGEDGKDGDSAYVYIAYASDDAGTDFTMTFDPALDYIAILATDTEIASPAVGDFAGLWKNLGGSGSEYSWNVNSSQQIIGYLTEPANIAVNVDGIESIIESVSAGDLVVTAINDNGETTPADVPAFDVLTDSTQAILSWDAVEGATGYRVYYAATGNYTETTSLNIDYLTFSPATAGSVPTENTAAIFQIPFTIGNADTVELTAENAEIETAINSEDATKKQVKIIVPEGIKTFLELLDTPETYQEQKGKLVAVNEDENALEFIDTPTPPFDCDELLNCDIIKIILAQLDVIGDVIMPDIDSSLPPVSFGFLYNSYVIKSSKDLGNSNFKVCTDADFDALFVYLGGITTCAPLIKDTDNSYWDNVSGNTNDYLLNIRGTGRRTFSGFAFLKQRGFLLAKSSKYAVTYYYMLESGKTEIIKRNISTASGYREAFALRLCRPAPGKADSVKGIYTGNNGRKYRTITINEIEWIADNLAETKFTDGTIIPNISASADWNALATPALCAYQNDMSNV